MIEYFVFFVWVFYCFVVVLGAFCMFLICVFSM